jgi:ACS family hexuronate transporter-like MFS transporter
LVSSIGYEPFFIALSALDLLAAVVVWTVIQKPRENMPA